MVLIWSALRFKRPRFEQMTEMRTGRCILVDVRTSGQTMSKSGNSPFSVTLEATTSDNTPVVIDPFQTILGSDTAALDYRGLTFKDTETGELAERVKLNATVEVPDFVTPGVTVEIPAKGSDRPYTITHTFQSRDN